MVRTAIQDAASVAGLLITTEAMIAELPKKDAPMPPMGGVTLSDGDLKAVASYVWAIGHQQ